MSLLSYAYVVYGTNEAQKSAYCTIMLHYIVYMGFTVRYVNFIMSIDSYRIIPTVAES
jgi:DNA polymerase III delta subunit